MTVRQVLEDGAEAPVDGSWRWRWPGNSLRILGTTKNKGPIVSFEMKGAHPHDVATIIDRSGVAVRAGTHCVMPLLSRFGLTATCRASFAMYNTRDEIDCLAQALVKAQDFFS